MSGIPDGARVLLDTMIFVYVLERHPDFERPCLQLFRHMEEGRLKGVASVLVFTEILHPYFARGGSETKARRLLNVIRSFPNLEIMPVTSRIAVEAARLRAWHGLRTPDALHAATAVISNAQGIVTNDRGLMRMSDTGLKVWRPADLPRA